MVLIHVSDSRAQPGDAFATPDEAEEFARALIAAARRAREKADACKVPANVKRG